ncbi:hypothetical protein K7X08_011764 [Anisodus acutangulus]|uniref:Uncharacterized protein n=1 Tax=Anisodus acutangulus TaxID=402998 RepID=A0A9Q1RIV1_9SOLA|nr:hypothetical protein K7X08_011764 [Anisodus acutangulus]
MDNDERKSKELNLKATELRLGLLGCESPERVEDKNGYPLGFVCGGYSDTIIGKWVYYTGLFSPRGGSCSNILGAESNV